jgi:hypothetical protein
VRLRDPRAVELGDDLDAAAAGERGRRGCKARGSDRRDGDESAPQSPWIVPAPKDAESVRLSRDG